MASMSELLAYADRVQKANTYRSPHPDTNAANAVNSVMGGIMRGIDLHGQSQKDALERNMKLLDLSTKQAQYKNAMYGQMVEEQRLRELGILPPTREESISALGGVAGVNGQTSKAPPTRQSKIGRMFDMSKVVYDTGKGTSVITTEPADPLKSRELDIAEEKNRIAREKNKSYADYLTKKSTASGGKGSAGLTEKDILTLIHNTQKAKTGLMPTQKLTLEPEMNRFIAYLNNRLEKKIDFSVEDIKKQGFDWNLLSSIINFPASVRKWIKGDSINQTGADDLSEKEETGGAVSEDFLWKHFEEE